MEPATREPISGALVATNLDLKEEDESEMTFPGGLSLTAELPASLAVVGGQGSGSDRLAPHRGGSQAPEHREAPGRRAGPPCVAGGGDRTPDRLCRSRDESVLRHFARQPALQREASSDARRRLRRARARAVGETPERGREGRELGP